MGIKTQEHVDAQRALQDETLTQVEGIMDNLLELAKDINNETKKQAQLIGEMKSKVSKLQNRLNDANEKISDALATDNDPAVDLCWKGACVLMILALLGA